MFLREPQGLELAGGGAGRALAPLRTSAARAPAALDRLRLLDWTPDLGAAIGTRGWWHGVFSCAGLCGLAWLLAPGLHALAGPVTAPLAGELLEDARAQAVSPLGLGADTGRRMAATDLVRPLSEAPERPRVELSATLGEGDRLAGVLARAGLARPDVEAATRLVAQAVPLDQLRPGTHIALTLGRRPSRRVARPLEALAMRARFDLDVTVSRVGSRARAGLAMIERPIAVDHRPLRLQGLVGSSLYRSVRAAGVPADAVADYMKAAAGRLSIGRDIAAADRFDVVLEQDRAATGEVRIGRLLLAAVDREAGRTQLVRWSDGGREDWFDPQGQGARAEGMGMPVEGHITSGFGPRFHPILGFTRMHKGIDIGAPIGTPVMAAAAGIVRSAGWSGGYGRFIRLDHAGTLATGYGHLSRLAVRAGQAVSAGQVIGYVGSSGMSTGPHLHWEVWRDGVAIDPKRVSFARVARLSGDALARFHDTVAALVAVRPGSR
ncbi:M23 family metallopeptidase [uncultured Sphingomonas sp.]|uniref:M23 family metallopeptidase n=1 Tax=uncultured Sphingomonas sp. TaxID=158754 RepID=UPI0035CA8BFB